MRSLLLAVWAAVFLSADVSGVVTIDADHPDIRYVGRIDFSNPLAPVLWWPGSQVVANFEGTSIDVRFTDAGYNYFYVIIDDQPPHLIDLTRGTVVYSAASGLTDSVHTIRLFKRTETQERSVVFNGFVLEDGKSLVAPPPRPTRRIEYYGDSITSGHSVASTSGDTNEGWGKDNYYTYASITARNLDAEYHCISVSGIGLYVDKWGFGGNMQTLYYDRTIDSTIWDFSQWTPQVVVVNLGQNDYWGAYTQAGAEQAYVDFTLTLRGHYPDADIVLALGSMNATASASPWPGYLQNAVDVLNQTYGDPKVHSLIFPYSGGPHPTVARHAVMADQLTAFLQDTIPGFADSDPAAPDNFQAHSFVATSVELTWADNSTNETGFVIQHRPPGSGSAWSDLMRLPAGSTSVTDTGGTAGVMQAYRVAAEAGARRSVYSDSITVAPGQHGVSYREWISQFFAVGSDTFLVDFNADTRPDDGGMAWNTITSLTATVAYPLADTGGDPSAGYRLTLTDAFDQFHSGNGSPLAEYDENAQDTMFASTVASPGLGQFTLSGLNKYASYDVTLFARRDPTMVGNDYRARYTLQGNGPGVTFEWDAASNDIPIRVFGIRPDVLRTVVVDVAPPDSPDGNVVAGISLLAVTELPYPGPYLIDFNTGAGPVYPTGESWNTVSSLAHPSPYALVNTVGDGSAGYTLTLHDGFDQFRSDNGAVPGGFSSVPEGTCFGLRDDVPLTAHMTFSGLDPHRTYDFTFLARRESVPDGFDDSGTYTFTGGGAPFPVVVDSAMNQIYADAAGITPDSSGNITLAVSAGPGTGIDFPVLNLIRMTPSADTNAAAQADLYHDPEGDGIVNLGEYGGNLDPLAADLNPFSFDSIGLERNPHALVGTYHRFKPAFQASYIVQTTTNLLNPDWQIDPEVSQSVSSDSGAYQTLEIRRPLDHSEAILRLGQEWTP